MRRTITLCLLALSALALLGSVSTAEAAKKKGPKPQITKVTPMRVSVGRQLVIRGKRFKAKRKANTVIFRSKSGRTAFAKPRRARKGKLVVRIPAAVSHLLTLKNSDQRPTRLRLRVLAGRFSNYTSRRLSPVVTGVGDGDGDNGGGGGGGSVKVCNDDSDHDNDLLSNELELKIGTDPCLDDTDGDQMVDGWEYYSAKDLNVKAVPYPGKRPYPNALDPSDGGAAGATASSTDFDGDGLTTLEEYRMWRVTGRSFDASKVGGLDLESPLGYSDGTQFSRARETPRVPAWRASSYGLPNPTQSFPAAYNIYGDAAWHDDERDADADGLDNFLESARGPSNNGWWQKFFTSDRFSPSVETWDKKSYCGYRFGHFNERPFASLDLADPDVDGDTLLDGEDDQDNDDVNNVTELYEVESDLDGNGQPAFCGWDVGAVPSITFNGSPAPVNAFNPCAPNPVSRTCPSRQPF